MPYERQSTKRGLHLSRRKRGGDLLDFWNIGCKGWGRNTRDVETYMCIGSQDREVIHLVCPFNASPIGLPVRGSHNLTNESCPPVASFLSIGSHSVQRTQPTWPDRTCDGVSVLRSHSRAVASPDPVANKFPVGENDAHKIGALCPE